MLLLHQVGTVKIGEVVRYTVSYTPSQDRILPSPEQLFVRIRNTSAIALRAAFVHGPYTLAVSAYPSNFDPNEKFTDPHRYGHPRFEPMLKAGGSWECELVVPDDIRQSAGTGSHGSFGKGPQHDEESASWIIEVTSQVIFSTSAAVGFEVVVARDRKSLSLSGSLGSVGSQSQVTQPGKISDHQQSLGAKDGHHPAQPKGVFSRAIKVKVEDTATLWNTPRLPGWDDGGEARAKDHGGADAPVESVVKTEPAAEPVKKKKVHLVVLTHGLHSNLGADMLYMKESIDSAVRQAKLDARKRRAEEGVEEPEEEEEVIVRGFSGNATRTERGIKYLGKRLARYVLSMTYPDQPFMPLSKGDVGEEMKPNHGHRERAMKKRKYQITSVSFIAHSLGGLVQTYAVAYIQKHSPECFDVIKPVNFVTLATPFLGLSNENPLYVKFALDFGLVGRTGKDLGLTWRAPTIARSGWGALVGNLGETAHKKVYGETQPDSKPLLRILPTGPAHTALKKFRNRTVYSNVVNDGIVPLRTSCLLFLDWQGLGRVEKARRETGLVETVVGFGWAELTGTNMASKAHPQLQPEPEAKSQPLIEAAPSQPHLEPTESEASGATTPKDLSQVPQPFTDAVIEDDSVSLRSVATPHESGSSEPAGPLNSFFGLFKKEEPKDPGHTPKQQRILRRGQTMSFDETVEPKQSKVTAGHDLENESHSLLAPPRTTFFESAGDVLNPKVASQEYLIDPARRPRTIFHDRVYHPTDIPPPPLKKKASLMRRKTGSSQSPALERRDSSKDYDDTHHTSPDKKPGEVVDSSNMRVEEKIARGYHRDLSWRKVLVKLEPDAHNNIFVRRMFANAYGWPVIRHLTDVHFSDSATARMRTADEHLGERARDITQPPDEHGGETAEASEVPPSVDTEEDSEARDAVPALPSQGSGSEHMQLEDRVDSMAWSERDWLDSENESDLDVGTPLQEDKRGRLDVSKEGGAERGSSPVWNWAEKIVGKGGGGKKTTKPEAKDSHET